MGAFHNPAITGVLPEVSCTNRPAGFSYALAAKRKFWCVANATVANVTVPQVVQASLDRAASVKPASAISRAALGAITTLRV